MLLHFTIISHTYIYFALQLQSTIMVHNYNPLWEQLRNRVLGYKISDLSFRDVFFAALQEYQHHHGAIISKRNFYPLTEIFSQCHSFIDIKRSFIRKERERHRQTYRETRREEDRSRHFKGQAPVFESASANDIREDTQHGTTQQYKRPNTTVSWLNDRLTNTHTNTHTHAHTNTHRHTCMHAYIVTYRQTSMHIHTDRHIYINIQTDIHRQIHMHVCIHTDRHACIHRHT